MLLSQPSQGSSRKTKASADLHHTRQIARSCQHAQLIPLSRVKRNILHSLRATNSKAIRTCGPGHAKAADRLPERRFSVAKPRAAAAAGAPKCAAAALLAQEFLKQGRNLPC